MIRRVLALLTSALIYTVPACVNEASPNPERRQLTFLSLAVPSRVALGDSVSCEVSVLVGHDTCWSIEELTIEEEQGTIRIAGTAIDPYPGSRCFDAAVYAKRTLRHPPLVPGTYTVVAGDLQGSLLVVGDVTTPLEGFVYRGRVYADSSGCAFEGNPALSVAFSSLPADLIRGRDYLVQGTITTSDPCDYLALLPPEAIDHFVSVTEATLIE